MGLKDLPVSVSSIPDIKDASTAFDALTVGWWTFNNTLTDEYSNIDFTSDFFQTESYIDFNQFSLLNGFSEEKSGLNLDQSYSAEIGTIASNGVYSINIGFWYFSPGALGFTRHAITKQSTPKTFSILAKADSYETSGKELIVPGQGEWIITEVAFSSTQNMIQVSICHNGQEPKHVYNSEPYDPGLHHIYINIKNTQNSWGYVRIDVDGSYGCQHIINESLNIVNTSSLLRLNYVNLGYSAHHSNQIGAYISNLIIQRKSSTYASKTILMARFGPEIALTSDDEFPGFNFLGIAYEQPSTITTNQIFSDGGSILLARSNGDILKGHRPIWDNVFDYKTPETINNMNTLGNEPEWTTNGINITGGTIRI